MARRRIGFGVSRAVRRKQGAAADLTGNSIELFIAATESNGSGTGNNLNELPAGALSATPLPNTLIFDARNINGAGAGWTNLIPGHMEQQPGNAYGAGVAGTSTDNTSTVYTNTVGWIGPCDQIIRVKQPNTKRAHIQNVEGGGRFSDSSTRGRKANYDPQYNDGAYQTLKTQVADAVAGLVALGYTISKRTFFFDLGGNDAIAGNSGAGWLASARTFLAQLVTDGIIGANDRIIFNTLGVLLNAAGGGIPEANRVAQNANIALLVADDPTHRTMIPSDDQTPMTWYWNGSAFGTDKIHLSAAGQWVKGQKIGWDYLEEWYPEKENVNGGAATIIHSRDFGDYRNVVNSQTLNSGALQTLMDWGGLSTPTQATPGNQPAIGARTLPNGLLSRYATGNGTSSVLVASGAPTMYNRAKSVMSGVLKGAARANDIPFCEAGGATNTPLASPFYNNNGPSTFLLKNDAGTVVGPTALGSSLYDGNWNQFLFVDDGTNARLDKNGVAGTPITSTRGTITVTTQSWFAQRYNNNATTINFSTVSWVVEHEWSDEPSPTVKTKLVNFYQTWHGSN